MEMTKHRKIIKDVVFYSAILVTVVAGNMALKKYNQKVAIADGVRQQSICPALLSISRSARDTLIVMKAEPLCNGFVLDSLK
jgi:hypothetical protein